MYWDVKIWWRAEKNKHEAGGHFMYTEGDTWAGVVHDVFRLRQVPVDATIIKVECTLMGDAEGW